MRGALKDECKIQVSNYSFSTHCQEVAGRSCKAGPRSTLTPASCSGHTGGKMEESRQFLYKPDSSACPGYILVRHPPTSQLTVHRKEAAS